MLAWLFAVVVHAYPFWQDTLYILEDCCEQSIPILNIALPWERCTRLHHLPTAIAVYKLKETRLHFFNEAPEFKSPCSTILVEGYGCLIFLDHNSATIAIRKE